MATRANLGTLSWRVADEPGRLQSGMRVQGGTKADYTRDFEDWKKRKDGRSAAVRFQR
jgi:hypothetical protein